MTTISPHARRAGAAAAILALPLSAAQLAGAASDHGPTRERAKLTLTERRPATVSGERFRIDYVNPTDPAAKPAPVRRVVAILPRGARIDTRAPDACTAADAELIAKGGAACPEASRIGAGDGTVDTGFPGPGRSVATGVEVFNTRGGFLALATVRDAPYRTVLRFTISGRRWTVDTPAQPGTPPDGAALDVVNIDIFALRRFRDGRMRNYITTPKRCPRRRHWTTRLRFSYDSGETQTVRTRTPCTRRDAL
ncbi:MAG: hypothetical protein QOG63_2199 [Thermoleophilaceae bacterium]|nr:hypothetical protein [Thermoleophilaceae bacterium]